jgi:transposase
VGIEACASSHHWSRELQTLGHTVRLMPPAYVKPYVKRQKNDMADAEAICEAVARANMRFVPTKTPEQQSCLMLHRTRHLFIRQRTALINSIRAHLAEFGIVAPVGRKGGTELLRVVADPNEKRVPEVVRACLAALGTQLLALKEQILEFDRMILAWHRSNQTSKRLHYIPGVACCRSQNLPVRRNFSAWIGLVPKQHSSGGKERLGSISKQGDRYLRSLFCGRSTRRHSLCQDPWHRASALAHGVTRSTPDQGRRHRARQQDCADCQGHDGQGRTLQATRHAGCVNEIAPDSRRDVKVGRANST